MDNTLGSIDVPMSLFGGLNTELSPSDLPEGVSPDNQDVVFLPGSVASRPALHKLYSAPITGNPVIMYQKTFIQPNGQPLTLILDANGIFWKEDVSNNPGVLTMIGSTAAGSMAASVTAFGREYFAISDGKHGTWAPLQYDGTNFDRVSQDGPGGAPAIANLPNTSVSLQATGAPASFTISTTVPTSEVIPPHGADPYWTRLLITTTAAHSFTVGQVVNISGTTNPDYAVGNRTIVSVPSSTSFSIAVITYDGSSDTGGTARGISSGTILTRNGNIVSGITAAVHGFYVGQQVAVSGVASTTVGGSISSAVRASNIVTIATSSAHGLSAGCVVNISGVTDTTYNGSNITIQSVPSSTTFTYANGGADGSSSAGTVGDLWNGMFYIATTPTTTTFTYQQIGPNDTATGTGMIATVGQLSPGIHQCVCLFETRQGYVTAPGPALQIIANGGQSFAVTDIPIGPANVTSRILAFTGAGGDNFFYIPVQPVVNNQVIGTSTVINDNTTTATTIDFADNTLFGGIAIDIPGNNLFEQVVLGPCLGVASYAGRLGWWGERNKIQNLLNMGFEGGYSSSTPTLPLGWTSVTSGGALISPGVSGEWRITGDGTGSIRGEITQPAFQDRFNIPILQPNTQYTARLNVANSAGTAGTVTLEFWSPTAGSIASAVLTGVFTGAPAYLQQDFSAKTPAVIPSDTLLRVYAQSWGAGVTVTLDELEIIYTTNPYINTARFSYVDNPEALDGVTGTLGPASDPSPIACMGQVRNSLHILTFGPDGRLHQTDDTTDSEPASWVVSQVSDKCGAFSVHSLAQGEDFFMWASPSGMRIFEGGQPYKISQEIQTIWDGMEPAWTQRIWSTNDPIMRRLYVGVPLGGSSPDTLLVLDYRELDSASQISSDGPVHISFTGKMISSDLTRKWTKWNIKSNCGALLSRGTNQAQFVLGNGNGGNPFSPGNGNLYYLDPAKLTDDDFGQISSYYTTYFFVNHEAEQQLQVASHRKLYPFVSLYVTGVGTMAVTPFADQLTNPYPAPVQIPLSASIDHDIEFALNVLAERAAFKVQAIPLQGRTDNYFNLNKFVVSIKQDPWSPVRGAI